MKLKLWMLSCFLLLETTEALVPNQLAGVGLVKSVMRVMGIIARDGPPAPLYRARSSKNRISGKYIVTTYRPYNQVKIQQFTAQLVQLPTVTISATVLTNQPNGHQTMFLVDANGPSVMVLRLTPVVKYVEELQLYKTQSPNTTQEEPEVVQDETFEPPNYDYYEYPSGPQETELPSGVNTTQFKEALANASAQYSEYYNAYDYDSRRDLQESHGNPVDDMAQIRQLNRQSHGIQTIDPNNDPYQTTARPQIEQFTRPPPGGHLYGRPPGQQVPHTPPRHHNTGRPPGQVTYQPPRNQYTQSPRPFPVADSNSCKCSWKLGSPSWGLDRINRREKSIPFWKLKFLKYNVPTHSLVDVYVVDTGILTTHTEFGGRAYWGINTVNHVNTDEVGHGTHVAAIIAGQSYGIARTASVFAVKVLGPKGGTQQTIVQGLEWIKAHRASRPGRKAIINMSFGGGKSMVINEAIRDLYQNQGILTVVAAGNQQTDACKFSPSSARYAITVACSEKLDTFCTFSNYGPCINIIAPGRKVKSAWNSKADSYKLSSGTSLAPAHVTGVLANHIGCNLAATPQSASIWLLARATDHAIRDLPPATTNKLLYDACVAKPNKGPAAGLTNFERILRAVDMILSLIKGKIY